MEDNEEEKVMLSFNEEDFIITISPTIDKRGKCDKVKF